jgi:hypothetical protein
LTNLIRRKKNVITNRSVTNPIDTGIIIKFNLFLLRSYKCALPILKTTALIAALTSAFFRIVASIYIEIRIKKK